MIGCVDYGVQPCAWSVHPMEARVFFPYSIDKTLRIGPAWPRSLPMRGPANLVLRTGRSFPPNHPTTKMCLRLILDLTRRRHWRGLVDVGCGCGVLALAGLKLGVDCAVGLDLSPAALAVSRANAKLNYLEGRLLLVRGSTEALAASFDLVIANLPMPVLVDKMPELTRLAGYRAPVVLSGFHDLDRPEVEQTLRQQSFEATAWLNADLSFFDPPPSGSYTWTAVLAFAR